MSRALRAMMSGGRKPPRHAPKGTVEGGQFIGRSSILHALVEAIRGVRRRRGDDDEPPPAARGRTQAPSPSAAVAAAAREREERRRAVLVGGVDPHASDEVYQATHEAFDAWEAFATAAGRAEPTAPG